MMNEGKRTHIIVIGCGTYTSQIKMILESSSTGFTISSATDFQISESPEEFKPFDVLKDLPDIPLTYGPQVKGRGGKIKRW
jgi:hypothetical protein